MSKLREFSAWINEPEQTIIIHTILGWFWIALAVAAVIFGFISSVVFVSVLSIIALSLSNWSAIQAVRTELKQKEQMEDVEDDVEDSK